MVKNHYDVYVQAKKQSSSLLLHQLKWDRGSTCIQVFVYRFLKQHEHVLSSSF